MYKLMFLDMDGTLLKNDKTISHQNILAIKAAQKKGVKIVLCTGRPLEGIQRYLKELNLINKNEYSITCSGALVQNNTGDSLISKSFLTTSDLEYLYKMAQFLNIDLSFYSRGKFSVYNHNLYALFDSKVNSSNYEVCQFEEILKNNEISKVNLINEHKGALEDYVKLFGLDTSAYQDFTFKNNSNTDLFVNEYSLPFYLLETFSVLKLCDYSYEVINKKVNKGVGVHKLSEFLNIPLDEIICIGDSGNDLHMINCAGLGVAMGNADNNIKSAANFITLTNEENGVAHVIENFIL